MPQDATTRLGPYTLTRPLDQGPAGPRFAAIADDGSPWEVRLLDRIERVWLQRRLRLIELAYHPALLRPDVDLENEPPYLAVPASEPAQGQRPFDDALADAIHMTGALALAHRVGLSLGSALPKRTADGQLLLDLTGTDHVANDTDPAADVATLGQWLESVFPHGANAASLEADTAAVLRGMQAADPADRLLAAEAEARLGVCKLGRTRDEATSDGEMYTPVVDVRSAGPGPGDRLGRFQLIDRLGEGGMGTVFRAEDSVDGTTVAIKVLRSDRASSAAAKRRFLKEGRLLAALDSPFVTRLIDANRDGDHCYLALEFVKGRNVGDMIRDAGPFDEPTALAFTADAARGLAVAHGLGIVHRDIKPDNLLAPEGTGPRVKVTDFGLARSIVQSESLEVTRAGAVVGTPLYMAPEQFMAGPVDPRADVYSLGATLFHMLAGRAPFPAGSIAEIARAVATDNPPPLDRVNTAVSAATAALVARCLSKDPSARPIDGGALLRAIENLRGNAPTEAATHPRTPPTGQGIREFAFEWELEASPARLWPYVSNTERLNRAIGLPAVRYALRREPGRGTRRFAMARVVGMAMEWEEHPFEWVEGRRLAVLREYSRGPLAWMVSIVELTARTGGGTTLRHMLRAAPRGLFGRVAAKIEIGWKARRTLGRVYRRIDSVLSAMGQADSPEDAFEVPTNLPRARRERLRAGLDRLRAAGVPNDVADLLGQYLATAPDQEVARLRPLAIAHRFEVDETAFTEACLRAVGEGLLELQWDVICPLCRIPSARHDTLREIKEHEECEACDKQFRADFGEAVELVFRAHPDLRKAEVGMYCAGGPAHSPHVVAQARIAPGETFELELALSEGAYRLRGPQLPWSIDLRITPGATTRVWPIGLASAEREPVPPLAPGGQVLILRNSSKVELVARVERVVGRDDTLTAARATSLPAFRDLFPGELPGIDQVVPAATVTLVWAEVVGGQDLLDRLGERQAFRIIHTAFQAIEKRIRGEGGTVVKTVGDGMLAAFAEVANGMRAALALREAIAAEPLTAGLQLRAAAHRGLALIATVNDRLDYFGHTANMATRLLAAAAPGSLLISPAVAGDPEVAAITKDVATEIVSVTGGLAYRLRFEQ
ncbi:MAG TPA: protein kinase [Gemmataceae bacterium]|jgi:class 3 adenylate cyclase|nr:protein kinase [Gemmataceae bacterium]